MEKHTSCRFVRCRDLNGPDLPSEQSWVIARKSTTVRRQGHTPRERERHLTPLGPRTPKAIYPKRCHVPTHDSRTAKPLRGDRHSRGRFPIGIVAAFAITLCSLPPGCRRPPDRIGVLQAKLGGYPFLDGRRIVGVDYDGSEDENINEKLVHLEDLRYVVKLSFRDTQITDEGLSHLQGLRTLESLRLDATRVSDAGLVYIKSLTNLTQLSLQDTQISDAGLEHLSGLINLEWLDLDGTQIRGPGLVHLERLQNLKDLWLTNTQVDDAAMVNLKDLTSLEYLDIADTNVTDQGASFIRRALPGCKVWAGRPEQRDP